MSVTTTYWLVGDASGIDLRHVLEALPPLLGMRTISWVFRRPFDPQDERPDLEIDIRNLKVRPNCLTPLFLPNTTLILDDDSTDFSQQLALAQREEIPEEVHGNVILDRLCVEIGQGELELEIDDQLRYRKFRIGFCIWTYSTPPDCFAFENYLVNSPGVQALKAKLETLVGPLESYILFG